MECSEKHVWNNLTKKDLQNMKIEYPSEKIRKQVLKNWDMIAKPLDSLGDFEAITAKIGAIHGTDCIDISKKAVLIFCADNGVVEEGISQCGQEVTAAVAEKMAEQKSSVGKMAKRAGIDTFPIDIGINKTEKIAGLIDKKIRCGTRNFRREPAITEQEVLKAISIGIEMVCECKEQGYQILATGEMGIGNTTTSSAIVASLLNCEVEEVTGRGAGLNDEGLLHKQKVIAEAIEKYGLRNADPLRILQTVGGLDIAGLTGMCIGGAYFHVPIVLDGVISLAAALTAERLVPGTKEFLLASHKGKEPAMERLLKELSLTPVIDGRMALGEGTGAVMCMALLDLSLSVYQDQTTFSDIQTEQYKRY